ETRDERNGQREELRGDVVPEQQEVPATRAAARKEQQEEDKQEKDDQKTDARGEVEDSHPPVHARERIGITFAQTFGVAFAAIEAQLHEQFGGELEAIHQQVQDFKGHVAKEVEVRVQTERVQWVEEVRAQAA